MQTINAKGVPCLQGTCSEVYLEKAFEDTGYRPAQRLPVAKELGETSLVFLVHPTLTSANMDTACKVIADVLTSAAHFIPPLPQSYGSAVGACRA